MHGGRASERRSMWEIYIFMGSFGDGIQLFIHNKKQSSVFQTFIRLYFIL